MTEVIFYSLIGILLFDFAFERVLSFLNIRQWQKPIPTALNQLYDAQTYEKAKTYAIANYRFHWISSAFNLLIVLLFLGFGGLPLLDNFARQMAGGHTIITALLFFALLGFATQLINLPFNWYDTFVIEQKFGFNKTRSMTFWLDNLKSTLLGALIGGILLSAIVWLFMLFGAYFWVFAWVVVGVFTVFFTFFYANLIVPLFNKQVPLATGALRTAIDNFAHKVGFSLDNIFVLDGSKRSTKANAYFTGLGAKKRIVLYDTLIQEHTSEELVAVLAHEIGHYKLKHSRNGLILGLLIIGVTLFLFSLFIAPQGSFAIMSSQAFGVLPSFHIGAVLFAILFGPITELFGVFQNYWSRKNEYQADRFAAKHADAQALISALSKLSKNNLTNLNPHPFYVFVNFSHPPLLFRIQEIQKIK